MNSPAPPALENGEFSNFLLSENAKRNVLAEGLITDNLSDISVCLRNCSSLVSPQSESVET